MRALDDADTMSLVSRPQDLDGYIEVWKETGRIGTHSEALRSSIAQRLRETNEDQAELRELSEDEALQGAKRLAAALTFGHATTVAVPGGEQGREGALDVAAILRSWKPKQRKSLLSRAIFDPATFGRVRFHHREVQELLTADWLLERLENGCPQPRIEELLVTQTHGLTIVRPSLRAVAAWVGQLHEGIRERLLRDAPEVLMEAGDPTLLPVAARVALLRRFAERYRGRKDSGLSINIDNVKRLVDPDLAPAIEEQWRAHPESEEVRELLLRLIWQGGLQQNASIADEVLHALESTQYERRLALRALGAAGSAEQRRSAVGLTIEKAEEWGTQVVAEAVDAFYPDAMSDEQLMALLLTANETDRATGLGWTLGQVAARVSVSVVERMLLLALQLVRREPYARGEARVRERYEWLLDPLTSLCERLLPAAGRSPSDALSEAVEGLGEHAFWRGDVRVDTKGVSRALADPQLTRHFFWRSFARTIERLRRDGTPFEGYWQLDRERTLWHLKRSDLDWLIADVRGQGTPDARKAALTGALQVWNSDGRDSDTLRSLREAAQGDNVLLTSIEDYVNPAGRVSDEAEERLRRREQREREQAENRQRSEQSWLDFRDELRHTPRTLSDLAAIAAYTNFGALWDINKWLDLRADNESGYSIGDWELLEPAFGRAVAEAARDGLSVFWRTIDCEAELGSDQRTNGVIVALTGLAIDARRTGWGGSLTDEEAKRAMKLAFKELNGVPSWIGEIVAHKPEAAGEMLRPLIANELSLAPDASVPVRVLERLHSAPPVVRDYMAPLVLDELERQDPRRPNILRRALALVLASPALDRGRLSRLAGERVVVHHNSRELQLLWLVALLCVDADAGVSELQRCVGGLMQAAADEFVQTLLNTLYEQRGAIFGEAHKDYLRAEALVPFLAVVLAHVRRSEDRQHEGQYTPDERDEAEHVRGKLLESFTSIPGRKTVDTLLVLRTRPEWVDLNERLLIWAERRAAEDGDLAPWQAAAIVRFEERYERPVESSQDLYEVACSRFASLKHELEHDDFSNRDLLRQDERDRKLEKPVQLWFAREFKNAARGQYTVHREEEGIDGDKPDIRLASEKADASTSIEIKVADSWDLEELVDALEGQLVGKYMRAEHSRHGVLLMTWHGRQAWTDGKGELNFPQLVERLSKKASELRASNPRIDGLLVMGIDLTAGRPTTEKRKGKRRVPKKREAA
jgi:hypothetical protein